MSENKDITNNGLPVTDVADNVSGVSKRHWFVAIVHSRAEKKTVEMLNKLGIESYLPAQKEVRVWKNGRKAKVDRIVIPSTLFIHCTESQRREIVKLPLIYRFMTNKAGTVTAESMHKPLAVISDHEISQLKFMLGQSDVPVTITERPYKIGDRVRIIRGSLKGLEGEVFSTDSDKSDVTVTLEYFGCAKLLIDTVNLQVIKKRR